MQGRLSPTHRQEAGGCLRSQAVDFAKHWPHLQTQLTLQLLPSGLVDKGHTVGREPGEQ